MENSFAKTFAREWAEAWNSHDINIILSHYTEDFEMNSPVIMEIYNEPSGKLKGKKKLKNIGQKH